MFSPTFTEGEITRHLTLVEFVGTSTNVMFIGNKTIVGLVKTGIICFTGKLASDCTTGWKLYLTAVGSTGYKN